MRVLFRTAQGLTIFIFLQFLLIVLAAGELRIPFFLNLVSLLESSDLSHAIRGNIWFYPAAEIFHLIGLTIFSGSAILLDIRLLGNCKRLPLEMIASFLTRWAQAGFALTLISGVALYLNDPLAMIYSSAFRLKIILILVAGINAFIFHIRFFHKIAEQGCGTPAAIIPATVSLVLWILIIALGRLIAYL
ncbi:MAG: putative rane protein [Paenibacillus sp.]|jgi:hypothetical protein|nr:putative rane protein [Paenibacillus sp.]